MGTPLSPETEIRVELLFPPEEQEEVRRILVEECGEKDVSSIAILDRVRFAALKLSRGRIDVLQAAVDDAKIDFRDVLMAAGFGDTESYKEWLPERAWHRD